MGQIIGSGACGNSPKNALVERFVIAMFDDSDDRLRDMLAEDVMLRLGDGTVIEGRDATCHHIARQVRRSFDRLQIDHAIAHGKVGAADATMAGAGWRIGFAVFVAFANAKAERLKAIHLYGL